MHTLQRTCNNITSINCFIDQISIFSSSKNIVNNVVCHFLQIIFSISKAQNWNSSNQMPG
ncbi:hypothetical protein Hanom_Chr17g01560211 [Helianthus anomalus]